MTEFFEIVFGLPTVVFTALTLISLGFFLVTFLFGLGESGGGDLDVGGSDVGIDGGADVEVDIDAGGDVDAGGDADSGDSTGAFAGLLQAFNLHILPLTLTFAIVSLVGWFVSAMATLLLTSDNSPGTFLGLVIGLAAFTAGIFVAGRVGNVLRPVFVPTRHIRRRDLIGRLCTVQTGRVDADFGQAEVVDDERSTHLIQIRCEVDNDLRTGMKALIVDVDDDGRFVVSPDVASLL